MRLLDKFRGCMIGGAAGDALGYPVEFMGESQLFEEYGESGITEYKLKRGIARISDDTQMTLFTANGLLLATTVFRLKGVNHGPYELYVEKSYIDWIKSQKYSPEEIDPNESCSWLLNLPEIFYMRAPGRTCFTAICSGVIGSIEKTVNDSKGCGGVMRVAPVGLYSFDNNLKDEEMDWLGAEISALTHGHELGYIPAATLTHIVRLISHEDCSIEYAVKSAIKMTRKIFKKAKDLPYFLRLMNKAIALSRQDILDLDAIHILGEGWVAEETLAIAVYCALKYPNNFEKAIVASVNHSGDSDSTGAVTGNIVGAKVGLEGIPQKFKDNLELYDVIIEIADDLYNGCPFSSYEDIKDDIWASKYIYHTYPKVKTVSEI